MERHEENVPLGVFRELARGSGLRLAVVAVLAVISAGGSLALPMVGAGLVAAIQAGGSPSGWVLVMIGVGLGAAVTGAGATYLLTVLGQRLLCDLRVRTVRHGLRMRVADLRRMGVGDLTTRLTADAAQVKGAIEVGPLQLPLAAVTLLGTVVIMALVDWTLLLATLVAFGVAAAVVSTVVMGLRRRYGVIQEQLGALAHRFTAVLDSITVVKACRAEREVTEDLAGAGRRLASAGVAAGRLEALVIPVITLGQQVALVTVVIGGGARVLSGDLALPAFVAFLLYLLQLAAPLIMAASAVTTLQAGAVATRRFDAVFRTPVEAGGAPAGGPDRDLTDGDAVVTFEDVRFSYGDEPVLRGVDFRVPARGLTAVVGVSGAGKSTTLGLFERFMEPDSGRIRVLGRPVEDWPLDELRGRVAYVDQFYTLLPDTVRRNLVLGHDRTLTDDEQYAALQRVGLADAVRALPEGLDTPLGAATDLSGGQRQRLALARALLSDARLVLLDEPSSQLDGVNENRLRDAIDALAENRSLLVVAHRLSTVRHADHVVVMHEGRVVGEGTPDALADGCPHYRALLLGQGGPDGAVAPGAGVALAGAGR